MAVRKKVDIPFDISLLIVLDDSFFIFSTALSAEGITFIWVSRFLNEGLLRDFDWDSAVSKKICPLYRISAIERFNFICKIFYAINSSSFKMCGLERNKAWKVIKN